MFPAKVRLKINESKTKDMTVNPGTDLALTVNGREVKQVTFFYISWQHS
jgi:hypothetical protein